jgi:hypothetical protein
LDNAEEAHRIENLVKNDDTNTKTPSSAAAADSLDTASTLKSAALAHNSCTLKNT